MSGSGEEIPPNSVETEDFSEDKPLIPFGLNYGLQAAFGAFFAISGFSKIMDPISFRDQILAYEIIGDPYAAVAAVGMPILEILCGAGLVFGTLRLGALAILNGALVVFSAFIISAWSRGLEDIECGCFGTGGAKGQFVQWVVRNAVLLSLGLFLMVVEVIRRKGRGKT